MIESATKTRIYDRFMRTNAPTAQALVWVEVRMRLGLAAVGSVVLDGPASAQAQPRSMEGAWLDLAPDLPSGTAAAIKTCVDDFASIAAAGSGLRSGMPFRMARHDAARQGHADCARIFNMDGGNVINDLLVVPGLPTEPDGRRPALVFLSAEPLDIDEVRFLHTAAGLHFAQHVLWESGQRQEPAVALKPRELECIRWAVTGRTLSEVAAVMGLSYRTVRFHLDAARARCGFSTNQQLFVQAAKDYGLDPDDTTHPVRRERRVVAVQPMRRMQPLWDDRRGAFDRRGGERRQVTVMPLPFPDRRFNPERRAGEERRAVARTEPSSAESLLTPEEIRALLS
ncbi:MAG: helix-turn-helix transcriptional regulator [Rhodospirillales bacterium]|nr:helix-turn-helix transcriptional regulator [Rhodospirillales bacterium]